jgi:hypothetical protein
VRIDAFQLRIYLFDHYAIDKLSLKKNMVCQQPAPLKPAFKKDSSMLDFWAYIPHKFSTNVDA